MRSVLFWTTAVILLTGCDSASDKEATSNLPIDGMWFNNEYVAALDRYTHAVIRVSQPSVEMWAGWSGDYDSRCREILTIDSIDGQEVIISGPNGMEAKFRISFRKDDNGRDLMDLQPIGANPTSLFGLTLDGETWTRLTVEQFNDFQFSDNPDCT